MTRRLGLGSPRSKRRLGFGLPRSEGFEERTNVIAERISTAIAEPAATVDGGFLTYGFNKEFSKLQPMSM